MNSYWHLKYESTTLFLSLILPYRAVFVRVLAQEYQICLIL